MTTALLTLPITPFPYPEQDMILPYPIPLATSFMLISMYDEQAKFHHIELFQQRPNKQDHYIEQINYHHPI